jgi:hypothetical protein
MPVDPATADEVSNPYVYFTFCSIPVYVKIAVATRLANRAAGRARFIMRGKNTMPVWKRIIRRLVWPIYLAVVVVYTAYKDVLPENPPLHGIEVLGEAMGFAFTYPLIVGLIALATAKFRKRPFPGTGVMIVSIVLAAAAAASVIGDYYAGTKWQGMALAPTGRAEDLAAREARLEAMDTPTAKAVVRLFKVALVLDDQLFAAQTKLIEGMRCAPLRAVLPLAPRDRREAVARARECIATRLETVPGVKARTAAIFDAYTTSSHEILSTIPKGQREKVATIVDQTTELERDISLKQVDLIVRMLVEGDATLSFVGAQPEVYQLTGPRTGFASLEATSEFRLHMAQLQALNAEEDTLTRDFGAMAQKFAGELLSVAGVPPE